ncbi:MAG: 16S rRNA (cytosine(967)-C(5))-methyltransferase RsmB [Pseudomonadota bacterium]
MNIIKQNISESSTQSNARLSAVLALVHTLDKNKPLDSAWTTDRYFSFMSPSDKAFTQLLVKTVLRHLGQIDAIIAEFLERPLPEKSARVNHILRIGIAQLIWLRTPQHAAVHSAVEITKQIRMEKFSGLVNAVLKKVIAEGDNILALQDAAMLNTPKWLWEAWMAAYGEKNTRKIAAMHMSEPPLDVTIKHDEAEWAKELSGTLLPTGSVRLHEAKNITHMKGFAEGHWWIQDVAATIPALLLGDVKGKKIIDFCAAPGGKTAQLVAKGAKVTAIEMSKERINILKTNLNRLKLSAECINIDANLYFPEFEVDAILLDAPCSATGTIRRHPDVAWHKHPEDIARLGEIQNKLLNHALDILKVGGILVYAVCSLQPEEGEQQITRILAERGDISIIPVKADMVGGLKECITKRGEIRTMPFFLAEIGGMDGFFAVVLAKKGKS